MPELPEVENMALGLRDVVLEQKIKDIWVQTPIVLKGPGRPKWKSFRNPYGDMGRFRKRLKVYGRKDQTCKACGTAIEKRVVGGRGTHFCPRCQV